MRSDKQFPEGLRRTVGLIVPPRKDAVPPEAYDLYPEGIDFVAAGLGLEVMAPGAFAAALERLPDAIDSLISQGAEAICLMGTSISFYLGPQKHAELLAQMRSLAGDVPVSTMTDAVIHGLRKRNVQNIVVASAYTPPVSTALVEYLRGAGFRVLAENHLEISEIADLRSVDTKALQVLGEELFRSQPGCDGMLISCGGLRTEAATYTLERLFHKPVVSSAVEGCHHAVALLPRIPSAHAAHSTATSSTQTTPKGSLSMPYSGAKPEGPRSSTMADPAESLFHSSVISSAESPRTDT